MIIPRQDTTEELERILVIFRSGWVMITSALYTLLYAIVTLLLAVVHVLTFAINLTIGVLTILNGAMCMARLGLIRCQEMATMGPQSAMIGTRRTGL